MLEPYTVLDLTDERGEIGPMLLGDLGADVIRVEPPAGSDARRSVPLLEGAPADLASLQFQAFNRNKRSIVLDPGSAADRQTLEALIARADFVFECAPDSALQAYGIDADGVRALNPHVVYVLMSPFGEDGPHAGLLGNDLAIAAMGGPVALQGVPERPPLRLSVPQVWRHTGVEAAAAALVAHANLHRTGEAQFVDVSAQCALTWTMLNAMDAHAIQGYDFERGGANMNLVVVKIPLVHPTADGHVVAIPLSSVIRGCLPQMIEDGIVDASYLEVDWDAYDLTVTDPNAQPVNLQQGVDMCRRFFATRKKQALFEFGLEKGITLAPVNTLSELLALDHMAVRDYWYDLALPTGRSVRAPGLWAKASNSPLTVRRDAPALGADSAAIRAELERSAPVREVDASGGDWPFSGVKVADFAWVGVGPISAKYLADHGATVVRVESEKRPDVLRANGPHKDGEPGLDRSQFFGDFNTSKQSLSLDLKTPGGIALARQLIDWSDVFIESFAPGAVQRMGLTYDRLRETNPGLIMVSTCLMGQTGPAASLAGYGYHAGAMAGFYEVTGWPDLAPSGPWVAYTDTIAPRFVSIVLAAALDHRRRTGEGCYLDVAQIETALHFLGPELLELQANGREASRMGNRSPDLAPQGCYPCAGDDNWCAIGVDTDAQWQALCREMDRADWAADDALASHSQRLAVHDEIDAGISAWTLPQAASAVMYRLQAAGVPAGVVQRSSDLLADPQYAHRGFYRYLDHPVMGRIPYAGHQYRIRGYDNGPRAPAPTLGQHSFEVLSELLGLSDEAIAEAFATGAVA